ncbi:hypothetical protein [Enterococcus villorum]|nr:hypothetical protein [Enterococcus villorum]
MPYVNDEQRYFDLIALALGMKDNDRFYRIDEKKTIPYYSLLILK